MSRVSGIIISALLLIYSFPDFNYSFLAWVALVPLLFAIKDKGPLAAFFISYVTGFLFFLGTIYWLVHVTLPGMIIVAAYLAVYFGLFGFFSSFALSFTFSPISTKGLSHKSPAFLALMKSPDYSLKGHAEMPTYFLMFFIPAAWVSYEWIRSNALTGFPWALLAHSQSFNLPVIQIADIFGAYGVSFLIAMVNVAAFLVIQKFRRKWNFAIPAIIAVFLVIMTLRYGYIRLNNIFVGDKIRVSIVQGNIPQDRKWDADFREEILRRYEDLTRRAAEEKPDLIIWPETSVPGFLESEHDLFERVQSLSSNIKTPLLVGTPREEGAGREAYYNSAVLFSADGNEVDTYDKMHLVPFGEYIPFKELFSFVEKFTHNPIGDFKAGTKYTVFKFFIQKSVKEKDISWKLLKKIKFSCLICFEDIFPDIARKFANEGASFLVNITNDAWFGKTSAAYQHAECSIFRAVENRIPVVRSTNTGLSCFIDQKGRILSAVGSGGRELFVTGLKSEELVLARPRTIYNRYGDVFAYCCMAFVFIYIVISRFIIAAFRRSIG